MSRNSVDGNIYDEINYLITKLVLRLFMRLLLLISLSFESVGGQDFMCMKSNIEWT